MANIPVRRKVSILCESFAPSLLLSRRKAAEKATLGHLFPSFSATLEPSDSRLCLTPAEIGQLIGCIMKCTFTLCGQLQRVMEPPELEMIKEQMLKYLKGISPEQVELDSVFMSELTSLAKDSLDKAGLRPTTFSALRHARLLDFFSWTLRTSMPAANRIEGLLLTAAQEQLYRKNLSFKIVGQMVEAFQMEMRRDDFAPYVVCYSTIRRYIDESRTEYGLGHYAHQIHTEYEADDTPNEYRPIGKPIPRASFCTPCRGILKQAKATNCGICMHGFTRLDNVLRKAVATSCTHLFHAKCLDSWVNQSAMGNSNTCPVCRTVLCESRAREHESL